jgi:hypothetical protein
MSALDVLPPKDWVFVNDLMRSDTHARMFHIGAAVTKVAAMFGTENQSTDAMAVFVLLMESMQNRDAECEARAMGIFNDWLARRELH